MSPLPNATRHDLRARLLAILRNPSGSTRRQLLDRFGSSAGYELNQLKQEGLIVVDASEYRVTRYRLRGPA